MTDASPPPDLPSSPEDRARAKRERILAVSRTVHSIPLEEGGMLKPVRDAALVPAATVRVWKRAALAAGGVAAVAVGLLLRRR